MTFMGSTLNRRDKLTRMVSPVLQYGTSNQLRPFAQGSPCIKLKPCVPSSYFLVSMVPADLGFWAGRYFEADRTSIKVAIIEDTLGKKK